MLKQHEVIFEIKASDKHETNFLIQQVLQCANKK